MDDALRWHQLKAKRGWTDASLVMLFEDFLAAKKLHADFVKFIGRK